MTAHHRGILSRLAWIATLLGSWLLFTPPAAAASGTVFVEVDYMVGAGHSHMPTSSEIAAIVKMFLCHDVDLIVVVDQAIPHVAVMQADDPDPAKFWTGAGANSFKAIEDEYRTYTLGDWKYCVFGHGYFFTGSTPGSSGLAEVPGERFIVTLGSFAAQVGTPFDRAATFAHELGHNFGLRHRPLGDPASAGDSSLVYPSIMSYRYQVTGVANTLSQIDSPLIGGTHLFKDIDYSNGRLGVFSESSLLEKVGIGIVPVDWDCDGTIETAAVTAELDSDGGVLFEYCGDTGSTLTLSDQDDWSIVLSSLDAGPPLHRMVSESCAPAPRAEEGQYLVTQPNLALEDCVSGEMIWLDDDGTLGGSGTGADPVSSVPNAVSMASAGSILYLQPGTVTNLGLPVTIAKQLVITGPGGGIIDP